MWLLQFWHSAIQKSLVHTGNSFLTPPHTLFCWKFFAGFYFPHLKLYKWITNTNWTLLMNLLNSPARNHFIFKKRREGEKSYNLTPHWQAFRKGCHATMSPYLCSWGWCFWEKYVMNTMIMHRCSHTTWAPWRRAKFYLPLLPFFFLACPSNSLCLKSTPHLRTDLTVTLV